MKPPTRRHFLKAAGTFAGVSILPRTTLFGRSAPGRKLNIALVGVWGRGLYHIPGLANENVAALCDVNERHLAEAKQRFPSATTYVDWRRCLEQRDLDAVVCCTTDHTHAPVAMWAMNRGLHIYCEKPIGITVQEARLLRETYLNNRHRIATQAGTHRHALANFARVREMIRDGAIGELRAVFAWGTRQLRRPGYLPAAGTPPPHLKYDLWLGPAPHHPYNPGYFSGGPGANCLQWNMYWDFGAGQVGDMGSHTMDLAWNAIDAGAPTAIEATGDPYHPEVTPVELTAHFDHPANSWRPAIRVSWYQGGALPTAPRPYIDLKKVGHGVMFKGTSGVLLADFTSRLLLPIGDAADLTYYQRRAPAEVTPPMGSLQEEWLDACKGNLKTSCNFDYHGRMTEQMNLALVAYRAGKRLEYDGTKGKLTNGGEFQDLLQRKYRQGWELNG
jgi:predicted dehydrogenase